MNILDSNLYKNDIRQAISQYDFIDLNNKSIFITGALGLICSSVIDILLLLRKEYGLNINIIGAARNSNRINERFGEGEIIPFEYDAQMSTGFPANIDFIIHGASIASPELYTSKPVETMLTSIIGTTNILQYCINKNCRMVFISSSEVYGEKAKEEPFDEKDYGYVDLDNIRNSYPEAKRASEMLCRSFYKEYGASVTIVRPGHVYGPTANAYDKRISSDFAYKAARGEKLIMLSAGLQERSYCYCVDAACAILLCMLKGKDSEAYNIGVCSSTRIKDMARFLSDAGKVELCAIEPTDKEKQNFNPMSNSTLSSEKLYNLGFRESVSPETGFKHTVQIIKELMLL